MPIRAPIPETLDEAVDQIAAILAQGYLRHRRGCRLVPEAAPEAEKVENPQLIAENGLDRAGHRPHSS